MLFLQDNIKKYNKEKKKLHILIRFFLPQTHTGAHRRLSENGIRHTCGKYAVKNRKRITI